MLKDALYLASLFFGLGLMVALMAAVHDAVEGWLDRRLSAKERRGHPVRVAVHVPSAGGAAPRPSGRAQSGRPAAPARGGGVRQGLEAPGWALGRAPAQERWMANASRDVGQKPH